MINKIKETLGQILSLTRKISGTWGDDITVNMDGGVMGLGKLNDQLMKKLWTVTKWIVLLTSVFLIGFVSPQGR